jgi:hypothetical protein
MKLPRWLRRRTAQELDEEIQGHLDMEIQANLERGLSPEESCYAALRTLSNRMLVEEQARRRCTVCHRDDCP